MIPYNYKGFYVHSVTGNYSEWDQVELEKQLKILHFQGIGIVVMKTYSAGEYTPPYKGLSGFSSTVKWVIDREFVDAAAVAMKSFDEINKHALIY